MSSTLYNEAINAAEQIKLAAEDKVKQQIIESISPQIKKLVEKKLFEESYSENIVEKEDSSECNYESIQKEEEIQEESDKVNLNHESRMILTKLIDNNSKREALSNKISELKESINSLQKAIILSEKSNNITESKPRIVLLYKNLINEITNLKENVIIRDNKELLEEYYKLNKELENMSNRHSNKKYLNESLESLLEMDLFEVDEVDPDSEDEVDPDGQANSDLDLMVGEEDPSEEDPSEEDPSEEEPEEEPEEEIEIDGETTLRQLAMMADLIPEDEDEVSETLEESDIIEMLDMNEEDDPKDPKDPSTEGYHEALESGLEESRRYDKVLEIDENMLREEIGKMKALREGEAKDMASHFGGGEISSGVELNKLNEMKIKAAKVVRMNRTLESKLSQYKKALRGMKDQLTEMNLFNAKLLYANKLMQNRDLSMKQQRNIVESLDEAKTLGEAKILFESLSKTLTKSQKAQQNSLTESSTRKVISSSSKSVRSAQSINESVALDRWATLAGIK